jgi:hypothetical protein
VDDLVAALQSVSSWRMDKLPPNPHRPPIEAVEFTGNGGGWFFLIVRWGADGVDGTARKGGIIVRLSSADLQTAARVATQTGYVNRSGVV